MKSILLVGFVLAMVASLLLPSIIPVYAQSSKTYGCTAARPCSYQVCGDHICAPGEFVQMQAASAQAQMGNKSSTTPQNMPSGNMTTGQSVGTVIGSVATYEDMASDGTIVIVRTSHPIAGQALNLGIGFFGPNKNAVSNQNYAITVTQDSSIFLSKSNAFAASGIDTQITAPLSTSDPINIQVTLNGVGPSTADPSTLTGVKGEVLSFSQGALEDMNKTSTNMTTNTPNMTSTTPTTTPPNNNAVPEFGTLASIVLAIAIISTIVIASKTRVIPRF